MLTFVRVAGARRWTVLLVVLVVFATTLAFVHMRRPQPRIPARHFQVPPSDGAVATSKTSEGGTTNTKGQFMTLDATRKFLINSITSKPVFITGEDAWSLQVQLSDADIQFYLADRASRGFNAIWIGLADNTYSNHPPRDFYGNAPFNGPDFTNENPAYWSRVDQTLSWAASQGITVFASPAFVGYGCTNGYCESYRSSSIDVLKAYGEFLGKRYKGVPNVVWVIGGDADPDDDNVQSKLYALAKGIKSTDPVHLMTAESYRGTSAQDVWSGTAWLDLDALYLKPPEIPAKANIAFRSSYPAFLFEDLYEDHKSLTDLEVRQEGYWAVLSGCTLGRIFGNYAIWNFTWTHDTNDPWQNQLGGSGSLGQASLGKLFRSREHWKLVPDINHQIMTAGYDSRSFFRRAREALRGLVYGQPTGAPSGLSVAARTYDGQTIIAYVPNGNATPITLAMDKIVDAASQAKCWWFNPRDGSSKLIGIFAATGNRTFSSPDGEDWVLVVDSTTTNLAAPGSAEL